jgi:catechol 2,3-dioxygenase-like lactoylglutathione lyase family enzyme
VKRHFWLAASRVVSLAAPWMRYLYLGLALAVLPSAGLAGQGFPCCGSGAQFRPTAAPAEPQSRRAAEASGAVLMVGLTVADMDRSLAFYTGVLTFAVESDVEVWGTPYEHLTGVFGTRMRVITLRLGDERLQLTEYLAASVPGRPLPVDSRSNDRWFQHVAIIVTDMDSAYRVLRAHKVRHASTGPQLLPKSIPGAAGISAFYFRDPDGHALEILHFPPDKGDPKWHRPSDRLFLGIDHTAIVVQNTEKSLAFYRDLLGLRVAGESHNFGVEQEHLNNVEGARLRITGLRSAAGPGIEFLEYQTPTDGRPYPADERANDVVHWQTTLGVVGLDSLAARLERARVPRVSRDLTTLPERNLGFGRGVLVRDPDGHVLELVDQ